MALPKELEVYDPLTALLDRNGYRDYFKASGWRAFLRISPVRTINIQLTFTNEEHASETQSTD